MYEERVKRLQDLMEKKAIDAVAVFDLENYIYFTGEYRKQPRLFIPKEGEPLLITFRGEEEEVRKLGAKDVRTYNNLPEMMGTVMSWVMEKDINILGFNFEFALPAFLIERFKAINPTVNVIDAREFFMELRMIKDANEISAIKKAAEIAVSGTEAARNALREGIAECDVAAEVEYAMRKAGAERFGFPTFVNSGYRSHWLHGFATRKKIEKGELVLVDLGPVYMGYVADMTRMFAVGKPAQEQQKLVELYLLARRAAISAAKPEARVMDLDAAARKVMSDAGYGGYYVQGIAHGIGLAFEEKPMPTIFPEDGAAELKENMVLSVGHTVLSVPKLGGARVEDTFVITQKGAEALTRYPEELIVV